MKTMCSSKQILPLFFPRDHCTTGNNLGGLNVAVKSFWEKFDLMDFPCMLTMIFKGGRIKVTVHWGMLEEEWKQLN